jgi:hypothetical protein
MDQMRQRRPAMTLTDEFVDSWIEDAAELMQRFGETQFELCLREMSLTSGFIPDCGQIGERLLGQRKPSSTGALEEIERHYAELAANGETGLGMADFFNDPRVKELVAKATRKGESVSAGKQTSEAKKNSEDPGPSQPAAQPAAPGTTA